jgi:protein arginine kinase
VARLSEQRCEVCGRFAVQWRVHADGPPRLLCAECTRRYLARLAPEKAPAYFALLQPAAVHQQHPPLTACPRCATETTLLSAQGVAGCADCYRYLSQAVEQWLKQWSLPLGHEGEPLPETAHHLTAPSAPTKPDAFWLHSLQPLQVILSSRARYARNFVWARFPWCADSAELEQVRTRVERAARLSPWRFAILPTHRMKPSERQRWIDLRLASPPLRDNTLYGSLIVDEARAVSVLVNEEDHLRVQAILPGLQLRESIALARAALEALALQDELAFSDNYGWLTTSALNIGWGLRVSVMMYTPAIERMGQLQTVWQAAAELGGTIRGLYGEGTPASALFQVSNSHSIGIDEATVAAQVAGTAQSIAQAEQRAREQLLLSQARQLHEEAEQVYHNLGRERTLRAADALQMLSVVSLAAMAGWGHLTPEVWKEMLMAVRWEAPYDDAEWRAIRMRTLVRQVRNG